MGKRSDQQPIPQRALQVDTSSDGITNPVRRAKTGQRALPTMIEIAQERTGTRLMRASIAHVAVPEQAEQLSDIVVSEFSVVELPESKASPIPAVHNGSGLVAFGFHADE